MIIFNHNIQYYLFQDVVCAITAFLVPGELG